MPHIVWECSFWDSWIPRVDDFGVDCWCFSNAFGSVFLIFVALRTGLKINGFEGGIPIQHSWGGGGKSHRILGL